MSVRANRQTWLLEGVGKKARGSKGLKMSVLKSRNPALYICNPLSYRYSIPQASKNSMRGYKNSVSDQKMCFRSHLAQLYHLFLRLRGRSRQFSARSRRLKPFNTRTPYLCVARRRGRLWLGWYREPSGLHLGGRALLLSWRTRHGFRLYHEWIASRCRTVSEEKARINTEDVYFAVVMHSEEGSECSGSWSLLGGKG